MGVFAKHRFTVKRPRDLEKIEAINSKAPPGTKRVSNIYWDPRTREIVVKIEG